MPVEQVLKYPISVEHDRDIRTREFLLCIANAKTEIVQRNSPGGAHEKQTFDTADTVTVLRVPYEEVSMFALSLVNNLATSGVQLPSLNGEVKRLEQMVAYQQKEIDFLRDLVKRSMAYHTAVFIDHGPSPGPEDSTVSPP